MFTKIIGGFFSMGFCLKCGRQVGYNPATGKDYKLCKSCLHKGKSKTTPKPTSKPRPSPFAAKVIDIDSLYHRLKAALDNRNGYQEAQDNLWKYIKRTRTDNSAEMNRIDDAIGRNTHEINKILNELTQYKKTHKAMNLAYSYLQVEINRIKKIISSWENTVHDVNLGRSSFITASGKNHTSTNDAKTYIRTKKTQLANLEKWLGHVRNYLE